MPGRRRIRKNHKPNLAKWATVSRFQKLIAAVEAALGSDHQVVDWHVQSEFMLSPVGEDYRQILEEAEAPVREIYAPWRWEILRQERPPADASPTA